MMVVIILVIFIIIKFMVKENIIGMIIKDMKVNGKIIKWMVKVNFIGLMGKFILDIIFKMKKVVLGNLDGLTEEFIKDYGKMENNMEKEKFFILKIMFGKKDFGMKERELDGAFILSFT